MRPGRQQRIERRQQTFQAMKNFLTTHGNQNQNQNNSPMYSERRNRYGFDNRYRNRQSVGGIGGFITAIVLIILFVLYIKGKLF